ncbi:MAG: DUF4198 domain-containing protein [Planctomycetaceae bacterium]|jgi:hypothetical protein|nr:DUF4198 domain-containing protein [Planctomycetaceae bacterium]
MNKYFFFPIIGFVITIAGCVNNDSRPADMPKLVSCTVTILSEGQPLPNVEVDFHSADPNFKWQAGATTDANGVAKMVTYSRYFGAVEGEYAVTVTKLERETFDPEHPPKLVKVFTLTDPQYIDPKTTPLKIKVSGKTVQSFDVGKTGKTVLRQEDAQ